ncbi:MAG: translation elongation factor Ts [Anaerolineae bacterium]
MAINTQMIKELREATGAGVLDCKKALEATDGDFGKAVEFLRAKGLDAAAKKASREANDGLVNVLVDEAGRLGSIVEVNCETDFVARTQEFQNLVAALVRQVAEEANLSEVSELVGRPFIEDQSITVGEHLTQLIAKLGENMVIRRFARLERDGAGLIEGYVHPGSRIGVLVHMSASDEQVASSQAFYDLVHDMALQVAAAAPVYVSPDDAPEAVVEAERARYWAQLADENKPDHIKERIVSGRLNKWYEEHCLTRQPFIKDGDLTIGDLLAQKSKEMNTSLVVERFVRYEIETSQ